MSGIGSALSPDVGRLVEAVAYHRSDPKIHRARARAILERTDHYADRAALQTLVLGLSLQRERGRLPEAIGFMERGFHNAHQARNQALIQICGWTLMVAYAMNGQYDEVAGVCDYFQGTPPEIPFVMGLSGVLDFASTLLRRGRSDARQYLHWR